MKTAAVTTAPEWDRLQRGALVVGGAGALVFCLGGLLTPEHFFRAYLTAYVFWLGIPLGCLVLLMVQHLTGGVWGILVRRILECAARTLLPLALFIVPLLFGLRYLYSWANPDPNAVHEVLEHAQQKHYLNIPFFIGRVVIYFAVWLLLAGILTRWSRQQDEAPPVTGDPRYFRMLSGPGLVLYGLTITFASVDWVMSLEPRWWSTVFPALFGAGQVLEGMAFAVIAFVLLSKYPPLSRIVRPHHLRDLGNLLLTFVMIWAYLSLSQFLLIWAENLPEETPWYLRRLRGGWEWVALLLVLFQFSVPFVFLLFRDVKENPRKLLIIASLVLLMRFVDLFWWIEAAFEVGVSFYWLLDVTAVVGLGGLWTWCFLRELRRRPLLPLHDPYLVEHLQEATHHE